MTNLDRDVATLAAAQHGVVHLDQLRRLGLPDRTRQRRVDRGDWECLYERVYRFAGVPDSYRSGLLAAVWTGGPRAVASHRAAAELWLVPGRSALIELTCPRWRRSKHDGTLIVHESSALSARDATVIDAIPVTTVERTIFDLCALRGRVTIDLAIDNALRRELATFDSLVAVLRRVGRRGRAGTRLFRSLLAERDPMRAPTESEREHLLLGVLRRHGFPEPVVQHVVRDERGAFVARVDLAYPDLGIVIEYESYQEHVGKQQLVRDSRRRNAVAALGYATLAATAEDVRLGHGDELARSLRRAISRARPAPIFTRMR